MTGKIHSIETLGAFDGPGIRTVVFFQGCPLRCVYCHNPDTRDFMGGTSISSSELLKKFISYKTYYNSTNGGVTFSGGEPLMQSEFLLELLKSCKAEGIHTAIDTSGTGSGNKEIYEEILSYADLVLLDIKHYTSEGFKNITQTDISMTKPFSEALAKIKTPLWIRHVVVPSITDSFEHLCRLKEVINKFENVKKIELLPYHTMGVYKYNEMGLEYPLKDTPPMDENLTQELYKKIWNE